MIGNLLRRIFIPHDPTPPPPDVYLTPEAEHRRIEAQRREVTARLERLRIQAEQLALRKIEDVGR
jgi:hypothetical protein